MADPKDTKKDDKAPKGAQPSTDPINDPTIAGDPERMLPEKPAHIEAQGDQAPPTPNAVENDEPPPGTRRFKLPAHTGWFDGHTHHPAGAAVNCTEKQWQALVKAGVLQKNDPELEPPRRTTEARGSIRR